MGYPELVKSLRICGDWGTEVRFPGEPSKCDGCFYYDAEDDCKSWDVLRRKEHLLLDAADAIEELLKAARAMHLWIFLNTGDEEKVYEECGLSDEMNAALGSAGKWCSAAIRRRRKVMAFEDLAFKPPIHAIRVKTCGNDWVTDCDATLTADKVRGFALDSDGVKVYSRERDIHGDYDNIYVPYSNLEALIFYFNEPPKEETE